MVALPASGEVVFFSLTFTCTTLNSPPPHVGTTRRTWRAPLPPEDNPAPSQLSKRPSGMAGGPPPTPTPRPDSASGQRPRSGPSPLASQTRRRPETQAIAATSNVPPTPQLAESPTKTPPRTSSSHTASSDSRRHRHLGTLSPCTPLRGDTPPPKKTPWERWGRN
ncbi:unnamed protein product [Rangifer tarandus platyrhynchus]|uniref:Uncharacterized protein n=1 Tax=Rangifer tarandus platyrhynchus TaxID=3082113 RepID=A0AC59YJV6_RANTA